MTEMILTLFGILVAAGVSYVTARMTAQRAAEQDLRRLRQEMKLDYSIETAIRALLSNESYKKRGLKKIKHHLRGFKTDDELRMALIRAGAVAFSGQGEDEMWGLIVRNKEDFK